MLYIFYGQNYEVIYEKALQKSKKLAKKITIINERTVDYKKEDIDNFLYYFLLSADEPTILIIEKPELISILLLQSFLNLFENIPHNHFIILVTSHIQFLPKTIISRGLLFLENEVKNNEMYVKFIEVLKNNQLNSISINEIIDFHLIDENNTIETTLLLLKEFSEKENEIYKIMNKYNIFIKNSYYIYWKVIYMIIHA